MTKPKIIFFDIDGTLVPLKEGIRPRTVEALQKLRQNGIKLCIATGRAPMEVPKFEGVTFDAFLTYNRALERAFDAPIPAEIYEQLTAELEVLRHG